MGPRAPRSGRASRYTKSHRRRRARRPSAGPVAGPGSGDPGPTGPRPSARRGATAAGPARPRRPDPDRAGIARSTQYGHGASLTVVGGSFGHAGPARGHPLPSRRPTGPPPAGARPTPPTRPPAAGRAGQAGREQERDCTPCPTRSEWFNISASGAKMQVTVGGCHPIPFAPTNPPRSLDVKLPAPLPARSPSRLRLLTRRRGEGRGS